MPIETWFPTVIFYEDVPVPPHAHARALAAVFDTVGPPAASKRYTASSGPQDLHLDERLGPLFEALFPPIRRFLFELLELDAANAFYLGRCWPVVQTEDGRGSWHSHGGSVVSGVFYLETPPGAGGIEFRRPSPTALDRMRRRRPSPLGFETVCYEVKQHRLLLFGSELLHRGLPNAPGCTQPRIAIAFDLGATSDLADPRGGVPDAQHLRRIA